MADYNHLDVFGSITTVEQIRDMRMDEFAAFRSQYLLKSEQDAWEKREAAFLNATRWKVPKPVERWRDARDRFIHGDDAAYDDMMAAVRLEDSDAYDEAANHA